MIKRRNVLKGFFYSFANLLNIYPNNISTESQLETIREIKSSIYSGHKKDYQSISNDFSKIVEQKMPNEFLKVKDLVNNQMN